MGLCVGWLVGTGAPATTTDHHRPSVRSRRHPPSTHRQRRAGTDRPTKVAGRWAAERTRPAFAKAFDLGRVMVLPGLTTMVVRPMSHGVVCCQAGA